MSLAPVTVCFTYFRSLALANLQAALYSVRRQDLSSVESIVILDNNTEDAPGRISAIVDELEFPVPVDVIFSKHGDASKTHSWSTNAAVRKAFTPWVLFTRADYLLHFDVVEKFVDVLRAKPAAWDGFVTSDGYHLHIDVGACELTDWRVGGVAVLRKYPGSTIDYSDIDSGVWMARRRSFERVGGLDEQLTAWGHAQTDFQYRLHASGTMFVKVPETLYYHPLHSAPRDIELAHAQLAGRGIDIRELWARHQGAQPYR